MACAANYAWVNRSSMTFLCRQAFAKMFNATPDDLDMHVVYDVSHNIAKAGAASWAVVDCWVQGCWAGSRIPAPNPHLSPPSHLPSPPCHPPNRWRSTWWTAS